MKLFGLNLYTCNLAEKKPFVKQILLFLGDFWLGRGVDKGGKRIEEPP